MIYYSNKLNTLIILHIKDNNTMIEWDWHDLTKVQLKYNDFITDPYKFTDDWVEVGVL